MSHSSHYTRVKTLMSAPCMACIACAASEPHTICMGARDGNSVRTKQVEIYCLVLTRGECAPQHNSLLPANQKDVLAYVQQRSPLIFRQQCSGDVLHSFLQWHWPCPGEHVAFCSAPRLSSCSLRLHQLLLSFRGFIYLGFLFSR